MFLINILDYTLLLGAGTKMRPELTILIMLTFFACNTSEQESISKTKTSEIELDNEKSKDLINSKQNQTKQFELLDTTVLTVSTNVNDELGSEYLFEKLKPIRENFKRINSIQKWDSIVNIETWESTEGGRVAFYYSKSTLEKVIVRQLGETYQLLIEYYLHDEMLSFAFEKSFEYNRPIDWDSAKMIEFNDNQVWDFDKSEISETRNYFENGILLRQLFNQDCGSPFAEEYLKFEQTRIHSDFKRIIDLKK